MTDTFGEAADRPPLQLGAGLGVAGAGDEDVELGRLLEDPGGKQDEEVRHDPLPLDLPQAADDGFDRDPLDVEEQPVPNVHFERFGQPALEGDEDGVRGRPPPLAGDDLLGPGEGVAVGDAVLAAQGPAAPAPALLQQLLHRHPLHLPQPHGDHRNLLHHRHPHLPHQGGGRFLLVALDIEQHHVRPLAPGDAVDVPENGGLRRVEGGDEEGAEAEARQQQQGLVVGAVEVGQSLAQQVAASGRQPAPEGAPQEARRARQQQQRRHGSAGEVQGVVRAPGQGPGQQEGGAGGQGDQQGAEEAVAGARPGLVRGAQGQQRRHPAHREQRQGGEQEGDGGTGGHPLGQRRQRRRRLQVAQLFREEIGEQGGQPPEQGGAGRGPGEGADQPHGEGLHEVDAQGRPGGGPETAQGRRRSPASARRGRGRRWRRRPPRAAGRRSCRGRGSGRGCAGCAPGAACGPPRSRFRRRGARAFRRGRRRGPRRRFPQAARSGRGSAPGSPAGSARSAPCGPAA